MPCPLCPLCALAACDCVDPYVDGGSLSNYLFDADHSPGAVDTEGDLAERYEAATPEAMADRMAEDERRLEQMWGCA